LEFLVFVAFAPHWTNGVDDVTARQIAGAGVSWLSVGDWPVFSHPGVAVCLDGRPAFLGYSSSDATTVLQVGVSCVYDDIHLFLGQVSLYDLYRHTGRVDMCSQDLVHNTLSDDCSTNLFGVKGMITKSVVMLVLEIGKLIRLIFIDTRIYLEVLAT
jgi:hypothetical protein